MHETNLPCSHRFKKITHRLGNKPFLIWLLITSSHLKYVPTPPCNLSLMACFGASNVSQGSAATNARCGGSFGIHLTTNLPQNFQVKKISIGLDLTELLS